VRNADKLARETKRILDERNLKETSTLPEDLATPLLEAAQREPREEILRLYAALAANAMDPNHDDIRPEYVETVRNWQPIDIRVISFAVERRSTNNPYFSAGDVHKVASDLRLNAIELSIDHLLGLKCIQHNQRNGYVLTAYGSEIMLAVCERT
jgi:hypothetical protein